jgi:penicillin-binding protein 2
MSLFRYGAEVSDEVRGKVKFFVILVALSFAILWIRVWYLQILKGHDFRNLSESNRIRQISLPPFRGTIKDRNGETLVTIRPSFNLYVTPEDAKDFDRSLTLLSEKLIFDSADLEKRMHRKASFKPVLVLADINRRQVAFVEENNRLLPGIHIKVEPLRSYVYGDLAAHALGFLGEISKSQLERISDPSYQLGDMIGKDGLESVFESTLRGQKGKQEVEVDVSGRVLKTLKKQPAGSGNNLILTLDLRLQKKLESLMAGTKEKPILGSAVLMKVKTGEILALTNKPSFDPNLFAGGISGVDWKKLISDPWHPLQNRSIKGQYPPGSTYKIVTAFAGLEEGIVTPEDTIYCPGHFRLGRGRYRCWKRGGHGHVNLHDALVQSCDVYFYTVGNKLGIDVLADYAKRLGLGLATGVNIAGEKKGLIPSTQWKLRAKKEVWYLGETISASIGQGYNLVTPMQQVNMISAVANGGILVQPSLVKQIESQDGKVVKEFFPKIINKVNIKPDTLEIINAALRDVVNGKRGTGRRSRLKDIIVSGKTGTSQVVKLKVTESSEAEGGIPIKFRDHAWFVAFAPYENPEVGVAVIIEHGGHGGAAAAPVAGKLLKEYFKYNSLETQDKLE